MLAVKCIVTAVLAIKIHCDSSPSNSEHNRKAGFIMLFTVGTGRLQTFIAFFRLLLLLLVTRPLPRDGGMAEDHGATEAGKIPRVWTRGRTETESRQRVSGAKSP